MMQVRKPFFGIQVVDGATGRGVPLVTLKTTSETVFVTDSAGWVAFYEPDLMGRELWLSIFSHGYTQTTDGFGFRGVRVTPKSGQSVRLSLKRTQLAERVVRLTGEGIWRDSDLLGLRRPGPRLPGGVMGQDSALAVPYRGRLYWFWGDTNRAGYPLGNFHTSGATAVAGADPEKGIAYTYFTDPKSGFCKPLLPISRPGPVWVTGVAVIEDGTKLVAFFQRVNEKMEALEQGLALWDDANEGFTPVSSFPMGEPLPLSGHPFHHDGWLYGTREGSAPLPCVRVRPRLAALKDPAAYQRLSLPVLALRDGQTGRIVQAHGGSVRYSAYRKCWVMIVLEKFGKASNIGEVWYGEAPTPTGPWEKVVQIATHEKMDFYNPVHHAFFDRGRYLYFEGTYVNTFSGNPLTVPRYNYNQLLYRLDLDAVNRAFVKNSADSL
jgi:hypothetical protein